MSATAIQSQPAQLHELGRYSLSDQERVLVGDGSTARSSSRLPA